jgi:nicotinamidase-related amidase
MANPIPDLTHAAVLSMDLQTAIVSIYTKGQGGGEEEFLPRVAGLLSTARTRGMKIVHVQVGFRPGLPEISSRNALFAAIKSNPQWQQIFEGRSGAIHPAVAPQGDDIVVTKHRISAFAGTDLDMILRANDVDTLVLLGIATSGVVLSTLLHAIDADYRVIVVKDCCVDQSPEVHACLTEKIFPRLATVVGAGELFGTDRGN